MPEPIVLVKWIAIWVAGAAATRVFVEMVIEEGYDEATFLCNPLMPFYPLIFVGCIISLLTLIFAWVGWLFGPPEQPSSPEDWW